MSPAAGGQMETAHRDWAGRREGAAERVGREYGCPAAGGFGLLG
ncbi:hypothetical protein HRbin29_01063 [bacterium HR29]|jgi:hypothetical protein|nr:hypothetical protein HRbin29_01063 [bacterium HR29]